MNYSHNNGMIIKYIDTFNNECIEEQETAIASVILQSLMYCNYIVINDVQYYILETKYIVSKNEITKNVYEVYIEQAIPESKQ